jgi:hypothetical protein
MRDQLIGYLLDALEPAEHEVVEAQLQLDPQLRRELELLSRSLSPLAADKEHYEPRPGLATRTCEFVVAQAATVMPPSAAAPGVRQWKFTDMAIAAGIFLAAATLFFPALNQSRFAARVTQCQNNLRQIGRGMTEYSNMHNGCYPNVPVTGKLAVVGIYGPRLVELRFITDPNVLVCPDSALAEQRNYNVPTPQQLNMAEGQELVILQRLSGGSYGYTLGYVSNGRYQPTRNLNRPKFALMADAPSNLEPYNTENHGAHGQNVLFEDEHVTYLTTCKAHGCTDHIFLNDDGERAPGNHQHDAVIGPSEFKLRLHPDVIESR